MKKQCETVTAQVFYVLIERFADCEPFSHHDIEEVLPWVEDETGTLDGKKTTRITASLHHLIRCGAVVKIDRDTFITDIETLSVYTPYMKSVRLGYRKNSKPRKKSQ